MPFDRAVFGAVALLLAVRRRHVHRPVRPPDDAPDRGDGRALPAAGSSAAAASTWSTTAATCRTWRRSSPTTTRAARSSSPRRCATTTRSRSASAASWRRSSSSPQAATCMKGFEVLAADDRPGPRPGRRRQGQGRSWSPPTMDPKTATRPTPCGRTSWTASARASRGRSQHAGAGRGGVHHGEHGRAELPRRQGAVLGQGAAQAGPRPTPAGRRSGRSGSKERGKPNQIIGWKGGDTGSTLKPPEYQKLDGPWVDGKDPAGA